MQGACIAWLVLVQDEISYEALVTRGILPGEDGGVLNGRVESQGVFDLTEFDTEAANLDLMIDTTEELDIAIGEVTHQIAGLV